jgi:SHS2 domain-containing protein
LTEGPTHSFEEHTGEVLLKVTARTLPQLFEQAGRALAELMAEQWTDDPVGANELVVVQALDQEALLVEWLNELVFRSETRERVYPHLKVIEVDHCELQAQIRGAVPNPLRTAVKAATYHRLKIAPTADGYTATVLLDV